MILSHDVDELSIIYVYYECLFFMDINITVVLFMKLNLQNKYVDKKV